MSGPSPTLTVIIPAYNEGEAIGGVLKAVREELGPVAERIIVVDDGSTDGTRKAADAEGVDVLHHKVNRGYGAALKTGIRAAATTHVAIMDSDGQHRPAEVLRLWAFAREHQSDMAIGARQGLVHSPLWRMPGKWLLTWLARYLTRRPIPDLNSGLRVIDREQALLYLHLCPDGFSISTTLTLAFLCQHRAVDYMPFQVEKRVGKSTVSVGTGFETILLILRLASMFNPLRIFLPIAFFLFIAGLLWAIPYMFYFGRGLSVGAMMLMISGMLIFALGLLCDQISQLRLERYR